MIAERNGGTCETMPRHFWMHEVKLAAIRAGADAEVIETFNEQLVRWFNAGEPV